MPSTGLFGPHALSAPIITLRLSDKGPGAYALGSKNASGGLSVEYVGRSDSDLAARLQAHARVGKYTHFKYGYFESASAAYAKECELFHNFGEYALDNEIHPASLFSSGKCPHCGC